jgi:hypothetical protein
LGTGRSTLRAKECQRLHYFIDGNTLLAPRSNWWGVRLLTAD